MQFLDSIGIGRHDIAFAEYDGSYNIRQYQTDWKQVSNRWNKVSFIELD